MTPADVRRAERVIDKSGLADFVDSRIEAVKQVAGRPRQLSVRTLLIALLLLSSSGTMHLIRVPALLNGLDPASKKRLGVTRRNGITRRQVERLYNLMADALDKGPSVDGDDAPQSWANFDAFCDRLVLATVPNAAANTTSIAIDGTSVDSWGTRRKRLDTSGNVYWHASDADAAWRRKSKDNPWKRPMFGFDLTVAVTVPEVNGPDVPLAARVMRFRPALVDVVQMGRTVVRETAKQQGVLGDVIADREYTKEVDGSAFVLPIRALGGEPVFELTKNQLGARGTQHGAFIIDGAPFSPSLPKNLHHIIPPPANATWAEVQRYQQKIIARSKYALVPHGSRKSNGSQVYMCPAAAGKLACPLISSPNQAAFPVLLPPKTVVPGSVCSKKFTTFHAVDVPLAQRDLHGSPDWFASMQRRSRVEGFFGNLKNEACENLRRGTIRVRGLVKTGILVAFAVASVNLRLARAFASRVPSKTRNKLGRPRKTGVVKYADVFATDAAANAPPAA